ASAAPTPDPGTAAATAGAAGASAGTAAAAPAAGAAPSAPGTNAAVAAPNPSRSTASDPAHASPEEILDYETARALYRARNSADAIDTSQAFLQTHPPSAFADNALFWMGESYFKLTDFEQAAVQFDRVVKRFPNGNKVPDPLYRQGVSLQEIGLRTN